MIHKKKRIAVALSPEEINTVALWEKSIRFSSSFHSYIGKSTIQQNSNRFSSMRPSSRPR